MAFKYTLLKQDGTIEDLGTRKEKMSLKELQSVVNGLIEIISTAYYKEGFNPKAVVYGNEEARFSELNYRNPHFKVLFDDYGYPWDVFGDYLKEEAVR